MTSLRWRGEGKERGAEENEEENTEEAKERLRNESTSNKGEEETRGGKDSHACSQRKVTSEGGEDARMSHNQQRHPRQLGVWLLLIILGEAQFISMHKLSWPTSHGTDYL